MLPALPLEASPLIVLPLLEALPLLAFWSLLLSTVTSLVLLTSVMLRVVLLTMLVEPGPVIPMRPPPLPPLAAGLAAGNDTKLASITLAEVWLLLPALPLEP